MTTRSSRSRDSVIGTRPTITFPLAVVLAVAGGIAIGNLYWAQPLLLQIAESFGVPVAEAGVLVTATQIGYALGILLIVPLGDVVDRRRLLAVVMIASAASLLASSLAPTFLILALAFAAVGLTTVSGQIILPMVGDLAEPKERGRLVGIVTAGGTTGILLSRTISGIIASFAGWRSVYAMAVALNLALAFVIYFSVPSQPARSKTPYGKLIVSVFQLTARIRPMRRILLMQGCAFLVFNGFWTSATFLLSAPPFHFGTFQIGLVSLAGLAGAAASSSVGRLMDRGIGVKSLGAFAALYATSMLVASAAGASVVVFVIAAAIMAVAFQGMAILCQTTLFSLQPGARSRLNTAFVVSNFLFGAVGSAVASSLWNTLGWPGLCLCCSLVMLVACGIWAFSRKMISEAVATEQ